jgi:transcription antitermination factor NusG
VRLETADPGPFQQRNASPCYGNGLGRQWAVAYTQPQAERWANDNLRRLGFVTYLPLHTVRRRDPAIRSLVHRVEVPLFSRYLFVQHNNPEFWRPIREAPGVASVIRSGERIQFARQGAVEAIQAALATSPPDDGSIGPGDAVCVSTGPLRGHPAVVVAVHRQVATIEVMLFGGLRTLLVHLDQLQPRE